LIKAHRILLKPAF
jgi:Ca2+-binding EF-hand superfamily protein